MQAGTVMGNILGVKKEDEEGPNHDGKRSDVQVVHHSQCITYCIT